MASFDYFAPRNCYRVRFTVHVGKLCHRRSRYPKSKAAARALLARVGSLEEASHDGRAEDREIQQWIEDGLLRPDEAAITFRGWADTKNRRPSPTDATDYDLILQAYEEYALRTSKARDPVRKTHSNHMSVARQVVKWLTDNFPHLPDLTKKDCFRYEDELSMGLARWTVFHYMTKLRLLLDRALELGMVTENLARAIKLQQPKSETARRILALDEAQIILTESLNYTQWINGGLPAVVRLGLYAGLRDEEMCWAKKGWLRGRILIVQRSEAGPRSWLPKDNEARRLDVKQELVDYLNEIQHDGQFVLRGKWPDKPLTTDALQKAFRKFICAIEMDTAITPYSLRHTYATELLRQRVDLRTVQRRLGHSNIKTTEAYLHEIEPEAHPTEVLRY